jgi:hypothetical protein
MDNGVQTAFIAVQNLLTEDAVVYFDRIDGVLTIIDYEDKPALKIDYKEAMKKFFEMMLTDRILVRYTRFKNEKAFLSKLTMVNDYIKSGDYIAVMGCKECQVI